eukprot:765864-Hanusia_phi.AAC.1
MLSDGQAERRNTDGWTNRGREEEAKVERRTRERERVGEEGEEERHRRGEGRLNLAGHDGPYTPVW